MRSIFKLPNYSKFVIPFETERLILRPFTKKDTDDVYDYASSINVGPNAGWKPHTSKDDSLFIVKDFIKSLEVWAIVLKESDKVIGSIGLHSDEKRSPLDIKMLGYVIGDKFWGKGYATEAALGVIDFAFRKLGISLISIYHYPHNLRSKRVVEKCGFKFEGVFRRSEKIYTGEIFDAVSYSLTKEEYEEFYRNHYK